MEMIRTGMKLVTTKSLRPLGDFYPTKGDRLVVGQFDAVQGRWSVIGFAKLRAGSAISEMRFYLTEKQITEYCAEA